MLTRWRVLFSTTELNKNEFSVPFPKIIRQLETFRIAKIVQQIGYYETWRCNRLETFFIFILRKVRKVHPVEAENIIDPIVGVVGCEVPSKSCLKGQIIHARCKIIQFIIYLFIDVVEVLVEVYLPSEHSSLMMMQNWILRILFKCLRIWAKLFDPKSINFNLIFRGKLLFLHKSICWRKLSERRT